MSLLIQYLVKLSISLAVVWLFYQFILRRLTFYNSNRWYLLGYTILSFFIPFINISPLLQNRSNDLIQMVPSVHLYTRTLEEATHCPAPLWSTQYDKWDFIAFGLILVATTLLLRFIIRYFSFLVIRRKATLISEDVVKIYQVNDNIIPFSFGNSIFINPGLHTEAELQEIIRHEFVHVRQKHTIDIMWAEMLCIINWYNPFAWLLKRSIRQNLEFIADNKVIENGINKKQYQYLLLKVIGNNQFSIATQFNFSSLKKRIVMMNKTKSAKRQLGRFLFLVPVLAIILLSFRKSFSEPSVSQLNAAPMNDTVPGKKSLNNKGFHVEIVDDNGNCTVVVKDKSNKEIKRMLLTEWNAKNDEYEAKYGPIATSVAEVEQSMKEKNPEIRMVTVKGNIATVTLKNGKTEVYTLTLNSDRKAFEERCGVKEVLIPSTIAVEPSLANPVTETVTEPGEVNVVTETIADHFEINDQKAVMKMRNGKTEVYNLADPKEKVAFEKKFGKIIKPSSVSTTTGVYSLAEVAEPSIATTVTVQPAKELAEISPEGVVTVIEDAEAITIEPEILLTLTPQTTAEQLESFKRNLEAKGFAVTYSETEFKNGSLIRIRGNIKFKDAEASFIGVDFKKITISQIRKGERTMFRIDESVKKRGIS